MAHQPHFQRPAGLLCIWLSTLLAAMLVGACGSDEIAEELPPDVAIILIDTLRKDFLDLYGAERETAPHLLRLGESSAVFDRAHFLEVLATRRGDRSPAWEHNSSEQRPLFGTNF